MIRFILLSVLIHFPATALALPYWPVLPDGTVYQYETPSETTAEWLFTQDGTLQQRDYMDSNPQAAWGQFFQVTPDSASLVETYYIGWCAEVVTFEPPLTIVRDGMQPGDSWMWFGFCSGGESIAHVQVSEETITVPMGTFDVLKVTAIIVTANCQLPFMNLYLHEDLGPVKWNNNLLIGIDQVVSSESTTWDDVKAFYRL